MALLLLACAACATWTWHGVHVALHAQQAREPRVHMAEHDFTLPAAMVAAGSSGRQIMADRHSDQQQQQLHTVLPSAPLPALWATLQLHARRRQQQQRQQQPISPPPPPPPSPPPPADARHAASRRQAIRWAESHDPSLGSQNTEGSTPALNMTWSEAAAMAELLFMHVLDSQSLASLPEFRHPQPPAAARLSSLLRRLWQAHAWELTGMTAGGGTFDPSVTSGAELLRQAADAAAELQAAACAAAAAALASLFSPNQKPLQQLHLQAPLCTPVAPCGHTEWGALPYVVLRRAAVLVLHLAHRHAEEQGQGEGSEARKAACREALSEAGSSMLLSFASAFNCSRAARPAMELFHVSKSGGTSMCQLAAAAGLTNPHFEIASNCMIAGFDGDPRWSRVEPFMRSNRAASLSGFWPAVECPTWQAEPEKASCVFRAPQLLSKGINFYANELTLHGGNGTLGSAAPCPQIETVIVLRDPVERARSHVIEVDKVYSSFMGTDPAFVRSRNLTSWQSWAPAVLDNYVTRSLLGRHFLCRDFGTLGAPELLAAARALTSLDHVLVLEEGRLNDVAQKAGMGWNAGLRNKHWRWATSHDLHRDLGFQPDSMQLLYQWNALDAQLYTWGQLLLRVDASFHTAVAALTGRVEPPCSGKAAQTPPPLPSHSPPLGGSSEPLPGMSAHSVPVESHGRSNGPAALGSGALGGRRSLQSTNQQGRVALPGGGGSAATSSLASSGRALKHATGQLQQQGYAVLAHRSGGGQVLERHGGGGRTSAQEQSLARAQALAGQVAAAAVAAARAAPRARTPAQAQMQANKFMMFGYVFVQDTPGLPGTNSASKPPALPLHLELLPAGLQHSKSVEAALAAAAVSACRNSSSSSSSSSSGSGVEGERHGQGGNGGNGKVDGSGNVAGRGLDTLVFRLPLYMPTFGQRDLAAAAVAKV